MVPPFLMGGLFALIIITACVPTSSDVCRAAYHAPNDQTITWQDGACVRITVQQLEAPKP